MIKRWIQWGIGCLMALMLGTAGTVDAQLPAANGLFAPYSAADGLAGAQALISPQVGTLRSQPVTVEFGALGLAAASSNLGYVPADPGLLLNLFDDTLLLAVNTRITPRALGQPGYVWYGMLPAVPYSSVILVVGDGILNGRVLTPNVHYYIAPLVPAAPGQATPHLISAINPSAWSQIGPPDDGLIQAHVLPQGFTLATADGDSRSIPRGTIIELPGAEIDVLAVYTPATQAYFGGEANTLAAIEGMLALTNQSYENSGVTLRVRLVYARRLPYTEQPQSPNRDLFNLTGNGDGYLDEVHDLRRLYGADLVVLVTNTPQAQRNYCGIAWVLNQARPSEGFSVSEATCAATVVMPHELGHNQGNVHDIANGGMSGGWFGYSRGYQDTRENLADHGDFVTIMAYGRNGECPPNNPLRPVGEAEICPHILYWSDPTALYNGKPLGGADTRAAQTLNQTAGIIAGYMVKRTVSDRPIDGGFEGAGAGEPSPWRFGGTPARDRVRCGEDDPRSGGCAFVFRGRPGNDSRVRQVMDGAGLNAGDALHLEVWARGRNLSSGGRAVLRVFYTDGTQESVRLTFPPGTYAYQRFADLLTLRAEAARVALIVRYANPNATGRLFVDDLRLRVGQRAE